MSEDYDYIVVGAGTAGCVVANRLSAEHRVLLLEGGGPDVDEWIPVPLGFGRVMGAPGLVWDNHTEPGKDVDARSINLVQGRGLGGGSSVNGMIYIRGQADDYDGWARLGCEGWAWDDVLPYFVRQTSNPSGDSTVYGRDGELKVGRITEPHHTSDAFIAAAQQAGLPFQEDMNGGDEDGVAHVVATIFEGRRQSAAVAFLHPIADRPTLTVSTGQLVTKVVFEGDRAVGVEVQTDSGRQTIRCEREVVLSAGAIGSPALLQHSGIGDPELLGSLDIPVVYASPEVGQNLQDHLFGHLKFRLTDDAYSLNKELSDPERSERNLAAWRENGTGPYNSSSAQVLGFFKSDETMPTPDVELSMRPYTWHINEQGAVTIDPFPGMMASAIVARPESRGQVTITSTDPTSRPKVEANYLQDDRDVDVLRIGMRRVREIMSQPAIAERVASEIDPGAEIVDDHDIEHYLRQTAITVWHPAGTCRAGTDDTAVLDPRLRVNGVRGLRVIDASMMPTLTTANTNAPAFMIGEKGAAMVLDDV